jgi:hypothetical protein
MVEPDQSLRMTRVEERLDHFETASLKNNGGDGTSNGMEARVAKLESDVGHIKETLVDIKIDIRELRKDINVDIQNLRKDINVDIRELRTLMLGGLSGTFLILGGMLVFGYFRLSDLITTHLVH